MKRNLIISIFLMISLLVTTTGALASPTSVDDTLLEIKVIEEEVMRLEKENGHLSSAITAQMQIIESGNREIDDLSRQLEQKQTDMYARIRAMYMFNVQDFVQMLFTAENMSDFFSKADKIVSVFSQDRNTLKGMLQTKKDLEQKKAENEEALQELELQKASIDGIMVEEQAMLEERNALLADQRVAEAYAQQIVAESVTPSSASEPEATSSESFSEEAPSPLPSPSGGYATQSINAADFDMICAIVRHEGGASYEGSLGVISCVMNRCDVGWGGTDPLSVLTAPYQFESYFAGYYEQFLGADIPYTRQAVRDCVEGGIRSHDYLSFRSYDMGGAYEICGNYYFYPKSAY